MDQEQERVYCANVEGFLKISSFLKNSGFIPISLLIHPRRITKPEDQVLFYIPGFKSSNLTPKEYNEWYEHSLFSFYSTGNVLQDYKDQHINRTIRHVRA